MTSTDVQRFVAPPRRSGIAVWRQIADTLAAQIRNRQFADSGRLPSETELAAAFGVNRHTVRQAVSALQAEGLLRVEQGRGMFVQHELLHYPLSRRTRFSENLQRQGLIAGQQWLTARTGPASARVAGELGLPAGAPVHHLESLSEASGQPISLMSAWYPAARFPRLLELVQDGASTSVVLAQLGLVDYVRSQSRITTQMPQDETARLLRQPVTRPLLCVESVDVDLDGQPVKYGETVFCGDRVQLCVTMEDTR